jgi:hypothetical protein
MSAPPFFPRRTFDGAPPFFSAPNGATGLFSVQRSWGFCAGRPFMGLAAWDFPRLTTCMGFPLFSVTNWSLGAAFFSLPTLQGRAASDGGGPS